MTQQADFIKSDANELLLCKKCSVQKEHGADKWQSMTTWYSFSSKYGPTGGYNTDDSNLFRSKFKEFVWLPLLSWELLPHRVKRLITWIIHHCVYLSHKLAGNLQLQSNSFLLIFSANKDMELLVKNRVAFNVQIQVPLDWRHWKSCTYSQFVVYTNWNSQWADVWHFLFSDLVFDLGTACSKTCQSVKMFSELTARWSSDWIIDAI